MKTVKILYHYFKRKRLLKRLVTREKLEKYQEKQAEQFVKKTLAKSPFYTERLNECNGDWRKLPIIDKTIMMNHFDTLNTAGINKEKAFLVAMEAEQKRNFTPKIDGITVGLSSGTSGNRGIFLVSDAERIKWAGTILAKVLPNGIFAKEKIAFFLRANSNLYNTVQSKRIQFVFYDLIKPAASHLEQLNDQQPTILVAPPAMLKVLAEYQLQNKLAIFPKKIISVADVLEPLDKTMLEHNFLQPIHQIYQCTEGFLATTCKEGTIHLNEDVAIFEKEYIAERKFIPIITDFERTTQPIVRYRLNDILVEKKESCPCGSPMLAIEQIEGRSDDLFYFASSKNQGKYERIFPDFIRRTVMASLEEIIDYRIQQVSLHEILIALHIKNESKQNLIEQELIKQLTIFCETMNCIPPKMKFVPFIAKSLNQKLRRIERICKIDGIEVI